jgi:hypothetical protein
MCIATTKSGKMIVQGVYLTEGDAELFSRALAGVQTKAYEDSETSLDDTQALNALVSRFRTAAKTGQEPERSKFKRPKGDWLNKLNPLLCLNLSKRFSISNFHFKR